MLRYIFTGMVIAGMAGAAFSQNLQFPKDTIIHFTCSELTKDYDQARSLFIQKKPGETIGTLRVGEQRQELAINASVENNHLVFTSAERNLRVTTNLKKFYDYNARGYLGEMTLASETFKVLCDFNSFRAEDGSSLPYNGVKLFDPTLVDLDTYATSANMPWRQISCDFYVANEANSGLLDPYKETYQVLVYNDKSGLTSNLRYTDGNRVTTTTGYKVARTDLKGQIQVASYDGKFTLIVGTKDPEDIKDPIHFASQLLVNDDNQTHATVTGSCQLHDSFQADESLVREVSCRSERDNLYVSSMNVDIFRSEKSKSHIAVVSSSTVPLSSDVQRTTTSTGLSFAGKHISLEIDYSTSEPNLPNYFAGIGKILVQETIWPEDFDSTEPPQTIWVEKEHKLSCQVPEYLPEGSRAFDVMMTGIGPAVDGQALKKLHTKMAELKQDARIGKVVDLGPFGIEGGHRYCVEIVASEGRSTLEAIFQELRDIKVLANTTSYDIMPRPSCEESQ